MKLNLNKKNILVYEAYILSSLIRLGHKPSTKMKFFLNKIDRRKIVILADSLAGRCYAVTSRIWYKTINEFKSSFYDILSLTLFVIDSVANDGRKRGKLGAIEHPPLLPGINSVLLLLLLLLS